MQIREGNFNLRVEMTEIKRREGKKKHSGGWFHVLEITMANTIMSIVPTVTPITLVLSPLPCVIVNLAFSLDD